MFVKIKIMAGHDAVCFQTSKKIEENAPIYISYNKIMHVTAAHFCIDQIAESKWDWVR